MSSRRVLDNDDDEVDIDALILNQGATEDAFAGFTSTPTDKGIVMRDADDVANLEIDDIFDGLAPEPTTSSSSSSASASAAGDSFTTPRHVRSRGRYTDVASGTPGWFRLQASPPTSTLYISRQDPGRTVLTLPALSSSSSSSSNARAKAETIEFEPPASVIGASTSTSVALDNGIAAINLDDTAAAGSQSDGNPHQQIAISTASGALMPLIDQPKFEIRSAAASVRAAKEAAAAKAAEDNRTGAEAQLRSALLFGGKVTTRVNNSTVDSKDNSSSSSASASASADSSSSSASHVTVSSIPLGHGYSIPQDDLRQQIDRLDASVLRRTYSILDSEAVKLYSAVKSGAIANPVKTEPGAASADAAADDDDDCEPIDSSDLSALGAPSLRVGYFTGRIRDDEAAGPGATGLNKLRPGNVILEGVKALPGCARVRLGHAALSNVSLFPGQVVVVRGVNHTGSTIVADAIFSECALPTKEEFFGVNVNTSAVGASTSAMSASAKMTDGEEAKSENKAAAKGVTVKAEPGTAAAASASSHSASSDSLAPSGSSSSSEPTVFCPDGLSMIVACGPFTTTDNITNAPLSDLLASITASPATAPAVLMLCGPFVDAENHPMLKPDVFRSSTYEGYYEALINDVVVRLESAKLPTKVIVVPSLKDTHHFGFSLPQPPFAFNPDPSRVFNVSNPALLNIAGTLVAVTSHDIVSELGRVELYAEHNNATNAAVKSEKSETAASDSSSTSASASAIAEESKSASSAGASAGASTTHPKDRRLIRLVSALLDQGSFYPIYPPPAGTSVDQTASAHGLGLSIPVAPDVLITPSRLTRFADRIPLPGRGFSGRRSDPAVDCERAVVCINPEYLAKGPSGGSYAVVTVGQGNGPVPARTKVEVVKI